MERGHPQSHEFPTEPGEVYIDIRVVKSKQDSSITRFLAATKRTSFLRSWIFAGCPESRRHRSIVLPQQESARCIPPIPHTFWSTSFIRNLYRFFMVRIVVWASIAFAVWSSGAKAAPSQIELIPTWSAAPEFRNSSWPSVLGNLLLTKPGHARATILNEVIGGNQLYRHTASPTAFARFDRDVMGQPGATTVILLEGINDIGSSPISDGADGDPVVTADAMIQAMQQLITRCHVHNIKIVGATLPPYKGARYYAAYGDGVREAFNQWIRTSGSFDAVIDFDKATEDPARPGISWKHLTSGIIFIQAMLGITQWPSPLQRFLRG